MNHFIQRSCKLLLKQLRTLFIKDHMPLSANIERQIIKFSGSLGIFDLRCYWNDIFALRMRIPQPEIGYWMTFPSCSHYNAVRIIDLSFKLSELSLNITLGYISQLTTNNAVHVIF